MRSFLGILVVVAACGDDGNVNPLDDAPPAPDTPAIDAPQTGLVTLTITVDGQPQVGIRVYFQNADSSLVSATMTDASGVASATMDTGGFVTAIDPFVVPLPTGVFTDFGVMKTFAGVKPGDNLVLKETNNLTQTNVNVIAPEDPTASEYVMFTNCGNYGLVAGAGSGAPAGGLIQMFGCGATIDLVIETRDSGGIVKNSMSVNGQAITEGGDIDLSLGAYSTAPSTTWMYGNVPANIETVNTDAFLATSRGEVVLINNPAGNTTNVVGGSATTAAVAHSAADNSIQVNVSRFDGSGLLSSHTFVDWAQPTTLYSLAMDNATLMPDFTATPTFDIGTRSVTWTAGGTNTRPPDLAVAHAEFSRNGSALTWRWDVVGPHGSTTIALPTLPAPDDQVNAIAGDSVNVDDLLTAQLPGGYDTIRANALTFFDDPTHAAVVGATGQIALQQTQLAVGVAKRKLPLRLRLPSRTRR